ncbi:MAG: RNB domain-containing ribonuclease [Dermatophilus congolensis]|nr:RNB domain-containing ribonuclease [Dermatophilus congolensis]
MTRPHVHATEAAVAGELREAFASIRAEFEVPETFPPAVLEEAEAVAASADADGAPAFSAPRADADRVDATDIAFVTIDPPGSMDLDQAVHIARDGDGFVVRYAIADVPAFVRPGGAIDEESRLRGTTLYLPDGRVPLHPPVLSEGAASLLPDVTRPAFLWTMRLDSHGELRESEVVRAWVRSRARYTYEEVQAAHDAGNPIEAVADLAEVGQLRIESGLARGAASLPMPEQIVTEKDGSFVVEFRPGLPAEEWNAQISLLTGMAAAQMMLDAGIGILRTMPPAEESAVATLRHQAHALGADWEHDVSYGRFLASLDRTDPRHLAIVYEATSLFRGAGYTVVDGETPEVSTHAAVAAPYAHVTAPLRRLVDRFGLAVCEALHTGAEVPEWVRAALPTLPKLMADADRRASAVDRAATDAVEAAELASYVGEELEGIVVDIRKDHALVQFTDPAVVVKVPFTGREPAPGSSVVVGIVGVDVPRRRVQTELRS